MRLTKEQAIANNRKMWRWIAEETLKQERKVEELEYFKAHGIRGLNMPFGECYCCEYAFDKGYIDCSRCPIDWGGKYSRCTNRDFCGDDKGLYSLWRDEEDYIKAAELAKQIAELPERK